MSASINNHRITWQASSGEFQAFTHYPYAANAAITIAIALINNKDASYIIIEEVIPPDGGSVLPSYIPVFTLGTKK